MSDIVKLLVAAIALGILMLVAQTAKAGVMQDVESCQKDILFESVRNGAAYGGAVQGGGAALGLLFAPAGTVTAGAAVGVVIGNAVMGALIGTGASLTTHITVNNYFDMDGMFPACVMKLQKDAIKKLQLR